MNTIGLIGGMSWESTAEYYRLVNRGVADRLGGLHSAQCLLYSVDFASIEEKQRAGEWTKLGTELANAARVLENVGASAILLCTNTMHKCATDIEAAVRVPLIHIADVTGRAVAQSGADAVTLLGTRFTMEEEFLRSRLSASCSAEIRIPEAAERREVDRLIFEELVRGTVRPEARRWFADLLCHEVAAGSKGVILGCTELPMLVSGSEPPAPVYDTTAIHAAAAVDFLLA